ncbi:MAG: hypothetical protein JWN86_3805 [Planctomycetota bacterium]|nr:hypothetical protein [Planctomycetota bacterium]
MRLSKSLVIAGLLATLAGTSSVRADFQYAATVNATNTTGQANPGTDPGPGLTNVSQVALGAGNFLTYSTDFGPSPVFSPQVSLTGGAADITFGHVAFTPSLTSTADTAYATNFNFTITIKDEVSAQTGSFTFAGREAGSVQGIGLDGASSITSTFLLFAPSPSSFVLGTTSYSFSDPVAGKPGSVGGVLSDGSFTITVNARAVPEPGSMALLGLGLAGVGLIARRRSNKVQATA